MKLSEIDVIDSEYLYNDSEGHDKVYNVFFGYSKDNPNNYIVIAEWGRRGGVLKESIKTTEWDNRYNARKVFDDLIDEKMIKKHYKRVVNRSKITNVSFPKKQAKNTKVTKVDLSDLTERKLTFDEL